MKYLAVVFLFALVISSYADELGTKNFEIEKKEDWKEKSYRQYINEKNYPLPFTTRISESFKEGQTIHALGQVNNDPTRIDFNLKRGGQPNADIPFHLSVRFDEGLFAGKIVHNNMKHGNWSDNEERISSPFEKNGQFDLRVRILGGDMKVYGNRREIGTFKLREPLDGIDHVNINGDLTNLRVFHYGGTVFPLPYTAIARLSPGKRLDISGIPTGKAFNINLRRPNGDSALQFSVRYNEGVIVRNTMYNNEWGQEQREGGFPLSKNEVFDITIVNDDFDYRFYINGKRFANLVHKNGSPRDIETLEISGEVELHTVTINEGPKN